MFAPFFTRFQKNPSCLIVLVFLWKAPLNAEEQINFTRDIRPIFSNKCFTCHGPAKKDREGGFRLDVKESAFGIADSEKHPIVPGDLKQSQVWQRMISTDSDEKMPPVDHPKQLTKKETDLIKLWIEQGAPWQDHWAYQTIEQPKIPTVKNTNWSQYPIDRFILARLEKEGLKPSAQADKVTLICRVTLDLTGLPPSPQEVADFLKDNSPNAYEKLVDRLLNSTRYGEHIARFWLDAARYGDTHGLHLDNYREIWPYRDWVIRAFNQNMPFDQFTIEQLAGDLLPNPTDDQLIATGFNRCHVTTSEGGSIKEEVYVRNVVDRVVTTGTVFLGTTLDCSRCHDHKYDPYTMNDFYSLFAFFNSIDGSPLDGNKKDHAPVMRVVSPEQKAKIAQHDKTIAELQTKLKAPWQEIDTLQAAWETEMLKQTEENSKQIPIALGEWHTVGPFVDTQRYLYNRKHGPEGKPIKLTAQYKVPSGTLKWKKRTDWKDGKVYTDLPGAVSANFLYRTITADKSQSLVVSLGSDDGIKVYLNNKEILKRNVARGAAPDQEKVTLKLNKGENHLLIKIINHGGAAGYYFSSNVPQTTVPPEVVTIAKVPTEKRNEAQQQKIREYYRNQISKDKSLEEVKTQLKQEQTARANVDRTVPTTLIWKEQAKPRDAFFLKRGEYDQRGDKVSRRTPLILPPMEQNLPVNRLGLAKWLTNPNHPLTSRVTVNRFWSQFFGQGLVKTADDFGSQGSPPSHPELLDWLAAQFMKDGWNVKLFMKQLVTSKTYMQSSKLTKELIEKDPGNVLFARGPRYRLDAEMLRDQALFVSGLLVEKVGGPGVKPPQPDGLWFAVGYSGSNTVRFVPDKEHEKIHRRTLYTFFKRTAPPPQMSTFDAPSREACTVRRERTNTPLQALLLMNDPQYFEAATALAKRGMLEGGKTNESRASFMFEQCTLRKPTDWELKLLLEDYQDHLSEFKQDSERAKKVISLVQSTPDEKIDPAEHAAWTMVANLILNLDEIIMKN